MSGSCFPAPVHSLNGHGGPHRHPERGYKPLPAQRESGVTACTGNAVSGLFRAAVSANHCRFRIFASWASCTAAISRALACRDSTSLAHRGQVEKWSKPGTRQSLTRPGVVCFQPQARQEKVRGGDDHAMWIPSFFSQIFMQAFQILGQTEQGKAVNHCATDYFEHFHLHWPGRAAPVSKLLGDRMRAYPDS